MGYRRIIAAAVVLALIVAALTGGLALNQLISLRNSRGWVDHSHRVIEQAQKVQAMLATAEAAQRGFIVTQNPAFLEPYDSTVRDLPTALASLTQLVSDNPVQAQRVGAYNQDAALRLALLDRATRLGRAGDFESAAAVVRTGPGRQTMQRIRARSEEIVEAEQQLLATRNARAERDEQISVVLGLGAGALALAGLLGAVVLLAIANRKLVEAVAAQEREQRARASSEALAAAIFGNVPDYLMVLEVEDEDRFVLADINPAFERALNVQAEAVRGRHIGDLMPAPVADALIAHYRRVRAANRPIVTRNPIPMPGGAPPRMWESILAPVRDESGVTRRIIGSIRDITERVNAEERLRRVQRMESIGQLTGGVAHDFNNLLQVIRGNIELLEPLVSGHERGEQRLKNALHGVERAGQLTRQLLAFARRQPLEPRPINLGRLVVDMTDMLRRTLGEGIEVETVIGGGLWNTIADPAQTESAILNLAINARDAMPSGGRLTIELSNAALDEAYARQAGDVEPGQYVMLAVTDTGEGMAPETMAKAFEPFFTTKSDGRGTGLGLSMVYGFVKQSGGHVQIYSEPGHGTTVKIYLPRTREEVARISAPSGQPEEGLGQVVLVVEDEDAVRAAAVGMLQDLGYRCLQAGHAQSALAILEAGAQVDLVFTDVVMPGPLKTRDFAAKIAELRPGLPVLFTSGYTENAIVHQGRLDDGVALLSKPYARSELARKIGEMLRTAQAADG